MLENAREQHGIRRPDAYARERGRGVHDQRLYSPLYEACHDYATFMPHSQLHSSTNCRSVNYGLDITPKPAQSSTFIVAGGDVVTMNEAREVLLGGSIVVADGVIAAVGSTIELRAAYPDATVIDATDCVVTPGMINAHQHLTGDPLVRSCIPDLLAPGASIFEWAVPIHAEHTADDDELSASLCAIECARNGVTTVVEAGTVAHPDRVAQGHADGRHPRHGRHVGLGHRGRSVHRHRRGGSGTPACRRRSISAWRSRRRLGHTRRSRSGQRSTAGRCCRARPRVRHRHDHAHVADIVGSGELLEAHRSSPHRPPARPRRARARNLLLAHGVWLDDEEIDLVVSSRTAIAYCPWAYLRLGQGVTRAGRHADIVERGGRVALGCDAANAGDVADILRTAALAAGIARDVRLDPERFGAHQAFELATIAGAEAIGMSRSNRIVGGRQAGRHRRARGDGLGMVAHAATSGCSWSGAPTAERSATCSSPATPVIRDGRCITVDAPALRREAPCRQRSLLDRAGITIPHVWPHVDAR